MAHNKLNDADDHFLEVPQGAMLLSSGVSGTSAWIERDKDVTVRLVIQTAAYATADAATLKACIDVGEAKATSEDGPVANDHHLHAMQGVQLVVKAGERVSFKAYPEVRNGVVLKTVVFAADLKS